MIKIQNEEACKEAMQQAWLDWHSDVDPEFIIPRPNITFEKGFRYCWMLLEAVEDNAHAEASLNE